MKKYKLGKIEANGLRRVIALRDFSNVKKGEIGGYVESGENLSHDDLCWVSGDALVYGNALVSGNARVYGNALVSGNAWVYGNARATDLVINVIVCPYSITITDGHVAIGCELLRKDHLAEDGKAAIKRHSEIGKNDIAMYKTVVPALLKHGAK